MKSMITNFPINPNNSLFGGLMKLYFITTNDILSEPEIFQNKLIGNYTFNPGKQLLKGFFDKDSGIFKYDDDTNNKGELTKNSFSAELSDNSAAIESLFCEMRCEKFIVFIIDNYKNVRVLGRMDAPATFSFSFTTKESKKNVPIYSYKFYTETSCILPITTTQITDIC